jgi:hypothetical protein
MAGFRRPGSVSSSAFGLAYERPRPLDAAAAAPAPRLDEHDPIQQARRALPVYRYRAQILYLVENHQTTLLVGETGSGKTTQLPQYLHEAGWTGDDYQVVCTQPRRVAASSIAARVAEEMGTQLGEVVGYAVRFEETATEVGGGLGCQLGWAGLGPACALPAASSRDAPVAAEDGRADGAWGGGEWLLAAPHHSAPPQAGATNLCPQPTGAGCHPDQVRHRRGAAA